MTQYKVKEQVIDLAAPNAGSVLATAHGNRIRPLCLCRKPNPEMYISKVAQTYIVKRMPNTGSLHATECESYEPPAELSGLGQVVGSAIQEDVDTGVTSLKLDFSLTKMGARKAPTAGAGEGDTVRTDGKKLTLRGMLHYLWDQAAFNRWMPAMEGKRNWGVIRRHIINALANKEAKGGALASSVFIPEPFVPDKKLEITQRRSAKLAPLMSGGTSGGKKLMLLIGEVKDITEARYGYKIVIKHLPDYHFMLNEDIHARLFKRFGAELGMWRENTGGHLIVVATFGVGPTGFASIEEASLMMVTPEWVPVENGWEAMLVRELVTQKRAFLKGLRYNLADSRPLASVVTNDTMPKPVAMYLIPEGAEDNYMASLRELCDESALASWFWTPGPEASVPALPARTGYVTAAVPERAAPKAAGSASMDPHGQEDVSEELATYGSLGEPEYFGEEEA